MVIAVIIFIIVVIFVVSFRRRNVTGRTVYTTPNISGQAIITQSGSQQMAGKHTLLQTLVVKPSLHSLVPSKWRVSIHYSKQ